MIDSSVFDESAYSVFETGTSTPSADVVRWPAKWRDSKIEEIQCLGELLPNWDSYGAVAADPRSIHLAVSRVRAIATETEEEPRVACLPNGHVMLAWESEDDSQACELEFLPNGLIHFMWADDNDPSADIESTTQNLGHILKWIPGTGV